MKYRALVLILLLNPMVASAQVLINEIPWPRRPMHWCRGKMGCFFVLLFLLVPNTALATVVINEVAWMGTSVSANDEWIELYNTGASAVDLSGWALIDNNALSIALEGSIAPGAYYLLERTDDETVPGIAANVIYTGALSNDGRTLTLKRANGNVEDQVSGGENWQTIGGDNATKDTAQRGAGSSWITATPTPKAANASSGSSNRTNVNHDAGSNEGNTSPSSNNIDESTSSGGGATLDYQMKKRELFGIEVEGPTVMVAGAARFFEATAFDTDSKKLSAVDYMWNFGNGASAAGAAVLHQYDYSGSYVVHVTAITPDGRVAEESFVIEVEPLALSIPSAHAGAVDVHNGSSRNADLSGWSLRVGSEVFLFPLGTTILAGETVSFPARVTGLLVSNPNNVVLVYPDGRVATQFGSTQYVEADVSEQGLPISTNTSGLEVEVEEPLRATSMSSVESDNGPARSEDHVLAAAGAAAPAAAHDTLLPWLLALFTLLTFSVGVVLYLKKKDAVSPATEQTTETISKEAKQFKIVED